MDLKKFIIVFAECFDDTDISEITPECEFHELEEWSSLTGMTVIAMAKTHFNKIITGKEIRLCATVKDLYELIETK